MKDTIVIIRDTVAQVVGKDQTGATIVAVVGMMVVGFVMYQFFRLIKDI